MAHSRPQLTPQQHNALTTRNVSIALSAGAGCGKTFVLTQRFLAHLNPGGDADPLGGIVAITFTDRAAREMRDRIRSACNAELERCSPEDVPHWLNILRGLDSARVCTIHSFCSGLLRAHAVEAGLDPRFGLLEDTLGATFLRNIVDESVRELLSRQDENCMQLVLHYGLERTVDLLRSLMPGRFQADFALLENHTPESLAAEWSQKWQEEFIPRLLGDLAESPATQFLLTLLAENEPANAKMRDRRSLLLEALPRLPQATDPMSALDEIRGAAQVQGGGGKTAWEHEDVYSRVRDAFASLRKQIDRLQGDLEIDAAHVEMATRFGLMASEVIQHIDALYESRKREFACLDFDDLLMKTHQLLSRSESARQRVAAGIDFLMVDEFQDTDPVQSEIVSFLCGSDLLSGKLFVVGDAKQSIYRFRRADPKVFSSLRDQLPEQGRLPLSTNFRSQPAVLNFVNAVFASSMGDAYESLQPFDETQYSPTPAIEFLLASETEAPEEKKKESAADMRRREADWIARRIQQLLSDTTLRIRDKDPESGEPGLRRVEQGDIAILFRTLSHVALYEDALREQGIEYYLVGSRAFYAQQEVYDLVNLCRYLIDSDDEVSLVGILRSPFFSLSDDTLFALTNQWGTLGDAFRCLPADSVPQYLSEEQARQARYAAEVLAELRSQKDRVSLAQLLNRAIERTGYDASLLCEFMGRRKVANLRKLIDKARQFDRSGMFTLTDFVDRLQQSIQEESDEELAATQSEVGDVVRLMTVHQSKGLEFPVVIVADMDWTKRGGGPGPHFHPELGPLLPLPTRHGEKPQNLGQIMHRHSEAAEEEEETVRLFYVAATRAADYLILSAGMNAERKPRSPWLKMLSERFDLDSGLPARDPYLGRLSLGEISPEHIPDILVHREPPNLPASASRKTKTELLPLSQFRETVTEADAAPMPELLRPIEQTTNAVRQFSVSAIETIDSVLHGTPTISAEDAPKEIAALGEISPADSVNLGNLVHDVLERMDYQQPQSLDALLDVCLAGIQSDAVESIRETASQRLHTFVESPVFEELQSAKQQFCEIDFLLRWPVESGQDDTVTITGQIDCLIQTAGDQWKIFDYKTGRVSKQDLSHTHDKYELQLYLYAMACQEFLGRLPESVELILLQSEAVYRVPLELTESRMQTLTNRITAAACHPRTPRQTEASSPKMVPKPKPKPKPGHLF